MSAGVLHLVIGLELGFEGLLETGGSLEQLVQWGLEGRREENVGLHIRHRKKSPGQAYHRHGSVISHHYNMATIPLVIDPVP